MATRVDGKSIAADILSKVEKKVQHLKRRGRQVSLAVVLVGHHAPSETYVRKKREAAAGVGINVSVHRFSASIQKKSPRLRHKKNPKKRPSVRHDYPAPPPRTPVRAGNFE